AIRCAGNTPPERFTPRPHPSTASSTTIRDTEAVSRPTPSMSVNGAIGTALELTPERYRPDPETSGNNLIRALNPSS
ncbi:hypothetical protein KGA66_25935, partial [Actinocrinis puniceicyclus]